MMVADGILLMPWTIKSLYTMSH